MNSAASPTATSPSRPEMLVYGDARRTERPEALLDAVASGGPHTFFTAAELAQGLLDAEFESRGQDELTPTHHAAMALLLALVKGEPRAPRLAALRALPLPDEISVTTPEGYAFYAVYPQAYRLAASSVPWSSPPLVIGLRSIGTGLAAVVAAATGGTPMTLRPIGHPFAREVRPSPAFCARLAEHHGPFAVVDEGPGLSGSSFAAVADLLEGLGVEPERILFLPSHAGAPGSQASARTRERWAAARRAVATLDDLLADDPMEGWFADRIGEVRAIEDLSGGAWRGANEHIPADPARERRKFRLSTAEGAWIARFAGLGAIGTAKWERARRLHAAGFAPEPVALRRGFLLQRWAEGARLYPQAERGAFLNHLGRYVAFRAAAFPASADEGATPEALSRMILANTGVCASPPGPATRVHVDGRLHAWEWLRRPDGGFCKLDALDHSSAHDLVGGQPADWDLAGAIVEFSLSGEERARLLDAFAAAGGPATEAARLRYFELAYIAFQLGLWSLADPAPANVSQRQLYEARLRDACAA